MLRAVYRFRNYLESQSFIEEFDQVEKQDIARKGKNSGIYIAINSTLKGERKRGAEQVQGCDISTTSREAALPACSWTQG